MGWCIHWLTINMGTPAESRRLRPCQTYPPTIGNFWSFSVWGIHITSQFTYIAIMFHICAILVSYGIAGFITFLFFEADQNSILGNKRLQKGSGKHKKAPKTMYTHHFHAIFPPFSHHFPTILGHSLARRFRWASGDPRSGLTCTGRPEEPLKRLKAGSNAAGFLPSTACFYILYIYIYIYIYICIYI